MIEWFGAGMGAGIALVMILWTVIDWYVRR